MGEMVVYYISWGDINSLIWMDLLDDEIVKLVFSKGVCFVYVWFYNFFLELEVVWKLGGKKFVKGVFWF